MGGKLRNLKHFFEVFHFDFRWLHDIGEAQFTDIHYRSLNGEANFNWRMIFPFRYSIGEDMVSKEEIILIVLIKFN